MSLRGLKGRGNLSFVILNAAQRGEESRFYNYAAFSVPPAPNRLLPYFGAGRFAGLPALRPCHSVTCDVRFWR